MRRAELRIADHPDDHVRALGGDINVLSSPGKCRTGKKLSKEEARKVWRARLQITPRLHPLALALPLAPLRPTIYNGPACTFTAHPDDFMPATLNAGAPIFSSLSPSPRWLQSPRRCFIYTTI